MKWTFLFLCFFANLSLYSQSVHIKELRSRPSPKFFKTEDTTIIYPVIITDNPTASRLINEYVEELALNSTPEDSSKTIRVKLRSMIRNGLTDMDYKVTYNKSGILSIEIDLQIEAAYPNPSEFYFNFNVRTGKPIPIRDIINDSLFEQFQSRVFSDKIDSLKKYRDGDLKTGLAKRENDSSNYQWTIEEIDSNCINSIDISNFSLTATGLKIIDECQLPHVIRYLSPEYELKYSYEFMSPYLRPEIRNRLAN